MAYSGPVYHAREQDRRGEFILSGYESLGKGIAKGIGGFSERLKEQADNKAQAEALDSGLSAMRATRPDMAPLIDELQDEYFGANLKGKQSIFSQLLAYGQRTDKQEQQNFDNGIRRRSMELQEGKFLYDTEPKMPTTMADPRDASAPPLMVNPQTGNIQDLPPLPNDDGAQVLPLGETGYGIGTYNGRPVTGAIPMRTGETTRDGLRLQPVDGTDVAVMVDAKGDPVSNQPTYRRAPMTPATTMRGALDNFTNAFRAPRYEPIPDQPPPRVKTFEMNGETYREDAVGNLWKLSEPTAANLAAGQKPQWIKMAGPADFVGGDSLFPTTPDQQPGKLNNSTPAPSATPQSKLDAARKAAGY